MLPSDHEERLRWLTGKDGAEWTGDDGAPKSIDEAVDTLWGKLGADWGCWWSILSDRRLGDGGRDGAADAGSERFSAPADGGKGWFMIVGVGAGREGFRPGNMTGADAESISRASSGGSILGALITRSPASANEDAQRFRDISEPSLFTCIARGSIVTRLPPTNPAAVGGNWLALGEIIARGGEASTNEILAIASSANKIALFSSSILIPVSGNLLRVQTLLAEAAFFEMLGIVIRAAIYRGSHEPHEPF
jgi:hypothetical protein